MSLKYRFDPNREFRKKVDGWRRGLRDLRWAWPAVTEAVEKHHEAVFDSEGRFDGGWINLSLVTIKARFFGWRIDGSTTGAYESSSVEREDGRILHWTHWLRGSLTKSKHPDAVRQFYTTKMVFGTKDPKAEKLHLGGQTNVGSIPPRPIIDPEGTQSVVVDAMQRMVDSYFARNP